METKTETDISIVRVATHHGGMEIMYTSVPGVIVRKRAFDDRNETREILFVNEYTEVVIDRGPTVHKDTRYGSDVPTFHVTWPSGRAETVAEMDREIVFMRVAAWMLMEMEMGIK